MEKKLDDMADGKTDYLSVMKEFYKPFREEFGKAKNSDARDAGIKCPICSSDMKVRHSKFGFFAGCISYPDCKGLVGIRFENDKIIIQEKHEHIEDIKCPKCESPMVKRDGNYGQFYSCSKYPKCTGKRKIPFGKKCSKCGEEMYMTYFKEEKKLACMGYPNCKNIEDLPEGQSTDWIPPKEVIPSELPGKIKRVLKKKVNYDE
mgnify:CR=1 FL=1